MEYTKKSKKSDKEKKNRDLYGKNTPRGVRFIEKILEKKDKPKKVDF